MKHIIFMYTAYYIFTIEKFYYLIKLKIIAGFKHECLHFEIIEQFKIIRLNFSLFIY